MSCFIKDPLGSANEALESFGVSKKALLEQDGKAVKAAQSNGLLDFPLANMLMDQAGAFLSQTATGLAAGVMGDITNASLLGNNLWELDGAIMAVVLGCMSAGTLFQQALFATNATALKRELNIRIMYYNLLLFHLNDVLRVMAMLKNPTNKANRQKLLAAYEYVTAAVQNYNAIQKTITSPTGIPMAGVRNKAKQLFDNAKTASEVLQGTNNAGSKIYKAVKSGLGIKDGKVRVDLRSAWKTMQEEFNRQVLGKTLYAVEALTWNMARMLQVIPVPVPGFAYTTGILFNDTTFLGLNAPRFNQTEADKLIENVRTAQGWNETFAAIDAAKGLVPTNILINQLLLAIMRFDIDYADFVSASTALMNQLSPVGPILNSVQESMYEAIKGNASEIALAGKEGMWVIQLNSLEIFRKMLMPGLNMQASIAQAVGASQAVQLAVLKYLENPPQHDKIIQTLMMIFTTAPLAPFSNRGLQETITLCTIAKKQIRACLEADITLRNKVSQASLENNALFSEALGALSSLPPPGPQIAEGLATGQLAAVAAGLAGIASVGMDALDALTKDCKQKDSKAIDPAQEAANKVAEERRKQAESAR